MSKYLVIFFLIFLSLIYFGNDYDYKRNRITKKEYDRRIRFFVILIFICIGIFVWIRKK